MTWEVISTPVTDYDAESGKNRSGVQFELFDAARGKREKFKRVAYARRHGNAAGTFKTVFQQVAREAQEAADALNTHAEAVQQAKRHRQAVEARQRREHEQAQESARRVHEQEQARREAEHRKVMERIRAGGAEAVA